MSHMKWLMILESQKFSLIIHPVAWTMAQEIPSDTNQMSAENTSEGTAIVSQQGLTDVHSNHRPWLSTHSTQADKKSRRKYLRHTFCKGDSIFSKIKLISILGVKTGE